MEVEQQDHPLSDGSSVNITRKAGRGHTYIIGDGNPMPSVTSLTSHIEGDTFSRGVNWAKGLIGRSGGNIEAPETAKQEAIDGGNALHTAIASYIDDGTIAEDNDAFISWLKVVGRNYEWAASERFLYHPELQYGGTVDAVGGAHDDMGIQYPNGAHTIWDWKTKNESYKKYGGSLKDHAQVAAYAHALNEMGSAYAPIRAAYIAYVMRDGSGVEVDLDLSYPLFLQSRKIVALTKSMAHLSAPHELQSQS
jgi:hypothetical protein